MTPLREQATVRFLASTGEKLHEFVRSKAGQERETFSTPSDVRITKPLEALQGVLDKLRPATTRATTESAPGTPEDVAPSR